MHHSRDPGEVLITDVLGFVRDLVVIEVLAARERH